MNHLPIITKNFIFDDPTPTPECHASTLVRLSDGTFVAAWFAGTKESKNDVMIWCSRLENGCWSVPVAVTTEQNIPHWNPVLFQTAEDTLTLYYKIGHRIPDWKTMYMTSNDGGKSWSAARELVPGDESGGRGPVKNKPIRLSNGRLLAPASVERGPWRAFIDITDDMINWRKCPIPVLDSAPDTLNMIQPALWESSDGHVHAMMRTNRGCIYRSDSENFGDSWSVASPIDLPNNNSGLDCAMLSNGTLLLVCNPVSADWGARYPLSLFVSEDNGITFRKLLDLETEQGEYSYPSVITHGSTAYAVYTWNRKKIVFCEISF